MSKRKFTFFLIVGLFVCRFFVSAQSPWSGKYGNEWLTGKEGQSWLRIGVSQAGLIKVSLPAAFQNKANFLHLYRRGVEVNMVSATDTEIQFYGVPNDGASDELLYRLPTSRKNKNFSTYSDQSAYFLTFDGNARPVAASETLAPDPGVTPQQFHKFTFLKKFVIENSHMTSYPTRPSTLNSYFEEGKAGTGTRIATTTNGTISTSNPKPVVFTNNYVAEPFAFQIKSRFGSAAPQVNVRLKGRGYQFSANVNVEVFAGKDNQVASLRSTGSTVVTGFLDKDYDFTLQDTDFANGAGVLGFRATGAVTDAFSVSYYSVTYDQNIDMQGLTSYTFNFPASNSNTRFTILNPPNGGTEPFKMLDVTDPDHPRIINGNAADVMMSRNGSALTLFATKQTISVTPTSVSFQQFNPSAFDYLIITNETLFNAANTFATYRASESPAKKYKPLVIKIKDLYNHFNYGEPSPVAIRRFVDYMVSDDNKDKYLLLLGKSITYYERMVRELPEEIPTIGFPGSDLLLVDGLRGTPDDVPVIPVGRLSAVTEDQVLDYLDKIKTYENQKNVKWRKNVVHINGGKTAGEVAQFAGYLSSISSPIISSPFLGDTINKPKNQVTNQIVYTTISPLVNGNDPSRPGLDGIGMITYFGHGNIDATDYDFGYATDPSKGYANEGKYPVLFYNGCGVNNIFSNRFTLFSGSNPPSAGKRALSLDWLLAPKAGAIVVFGNDWDAYASTSNEYLDRLYPKIFSKTDDERLTIGQILRDVALDTKLAKGYTYNVGQNARALSYYDADRANIHQVILQGDPALRILISENPLPVDLVSFTAKAAGADKVEVKWTTASERDNSHFLVERSYNGRQFETIGTVDGKGDSDTPTNYLFSDLSPLAGTSYYRLKQVDRVTVVDGKEVDGKVTLSSIVSVTREGTTALVAAPNPTSSWVDLRLDVPAKIKSWDVIDQKGVFYQKDGIGSRVHLENLPAGEYIIRIKTTNDDVYLKKVLKK